MIIFCITGLKYIKINVTCFRFMRPLENSWLHMQLALYLRHCPGSLRAAARHHLSHTGPKCSKHRPGISGHPGICWRHCCQQAPCFTHTHLKLKHGNFCLLPEVEPHFKVKLLLEKQLYFSHCLIQQIFTETCSPEPTRFMCSHFQLVLLWAHCYPFIKENHNVGSEKGLLCF